MIFQEVLTRFPGAVKNGQGYKALCPAHADQNPSLRLTEGRDGKTLVHCYAGCKPAAVAAAAGLSVTDLFAAPALQKEKVRQQTMRRSTADIEATYDFCDEDGTLLFQEVRYRNPKGFSQRRPDGRGGWVWNLNGMRLVLYGLPELMSSSGDVFVVEGPKDAEAVRALGLIATTNPMGAGKWRDEYSKTLRGRNVVILPDNDEPGRAHARAVAKALQGIATSVKVLELPNLPHKGDVSDWIKAGLTAGDDVETLAESLCMLAEHAPEWPEAKLPITHTSNSEDDESPLRIVRLADVAPETVTWLWFPYIAFAKLTLIEGDPGVGKSWLTCALATAVAAGLGLPGMEAMRPRNVLMLSAEDGLGDTIRPRLDSMQADVSRIFAVDEPVSFDTTGLLRIESAIQHFQPALVIVDPLVAFLGAAVDMHRANETRAVMTRLAEVASRHQCAIAIVRHLSKGAGGKAIYRGQGSIDFLAAVRSSLLVGCDPDDPAKRAIVQIKNNLEAFGNPLGYEIREGQFRWTGESDLTADRLLSFGTRDESAEWSNARSDAEAFLKEILADGTQLVSDIEEQARKAGISKATLRRAKDRLGIKTRKSAYQGKWQWELPQTETKED